jgi:hypothetical protein
VWRRGRDARSESRAQKKKKSARANGKKSAVFSIVISAGSRVFSLSSC